MKNPIINELIKLKLISKLNLTTLSNKTRDKKIKVIKDLKTKIIFLSLVLLFKVIKFNLEINFNFNNSLKIGFFTLI